MEFKNARALITGGSKGIGKALGAALAAEGARVGITARREEPLRAAAKEIGALALPGDVSREPDANAAVAAFVKEFGGIDILVNNAGVGVLATLDEIDVASFERVFAVNVTGAMLMAREAAPHMIRQGSGNIVNISSTAGTRGFAGGTTYVASKFALKGMSECWRDELRRHGVRVILVNPSEVQTGFGRDTEPADLHPRKLTAADIADGVMGVLRMNERGFVPEFSIFATNPF